MEILHDRRKIENAIGQLNIHEIMNTEGIEFAILSGRKGELLITPERPFPYFAFVIRGKGRIYQLDDEGSMTPVAPLIPGYALGDLEFVRNDFYGTQYVEADSAVECLAVDMRLYRDRLNSDVLFLRYVNLSLVRKMIEISRNSNSAESLRVRVIHYLMSQTEEGGNGGVIEGVGNATMFLHCSRRQLQRVLSELCAEGMLIREKKGRYRLTDAGKSDFE